jgi:hypothetical protein
MEMGATKDETRKVYDAYREAGGNFIDTAKYIRTAPASGSWVSLSRTIGRA